MTNNPQGSDYDKMVELSLNILMDYEIYDFPLKIKILAKKLNIELKKYSMLDFFEYEFLNEKSPYGITVMSIHNNKHIDFETFYNDADFNSNKNRFTIAHEIGHIANGDVKKNITEKDEKLYDYFAKCLLAPQCLIIENKEYDVNTIATKYKVSKQVAEYWLQAIKSRISSYGECCLTDMEKAYLQRIKKYHNLQPGSNRL